MMDIMLPLEKLRNKRKVFHSEADFQFALAWEIQLIYPNANVRLEYCPTAASNMHIDILVEHQSGLYPIELKYKTLLTEITVDGEVFNLKNHGAQDIGKYDFLADVQRIEHLSSVLPHFRQGFAVWLTNDPAYWSNSIRQNTIAEAFQLFDGAVKQGEMAWAAHAGNGTTKGRETPVVLAGSYVVKWHEYSRLSDDRNGCFNYAICQVKGKENRPASSMTG